MFRRSELEIEARNFFPSQTRVTISLFERERAHTVGTMVFGPFCNGHTSNAACLNTVPVNNDGWNFSLFLKSYGSSATLGGFHRVVEHDPREESYRSDGRATPADGQWSQRPWEEGNVCSSMLARAAYHRIFSPVKIKQLFSPLRERERERGRDDPAEIVPPTVPIDRPDKYN